MVQIGQVFTQSDVPYLSVQTKYMCFDIKNERGRDK